MRVTKTIEVNIYDTGELIEFTINEDRTFVCSVKKAVELFELLCRSDESVSSIFRPTDINIDSVINKNNDNAADNSNAGPFSASEPIEYETTTNVPGDFKPATTPKPVKRTAKKRRKVK